jgi:hypothetical protein
MTSTLLQCRGATSPAAWSSPSSTVRATPLLVTAVVAARQQAVEASRQASVRQVAAVAPQQAVEEAAPLAVPAPLRPPARANKRMSFSMTTRYRPTRTSLCRSGYGNFSSLGRPCQTRRPRRRLRLTRRPRRRGWQELLGTRRPPARGPPWPGPRGRLQPTSQTPLHGCLETSVCPASSLFFFFLGLHSLITSRFAEHLSLRRGHRNGYSCFCRRHRCRRCGCRGDSRVGS